LIRASANDVVGNENDKCIEILLKGVTQPHPNLAPISFTIESFSTAVYPGTLYNYDSSATNNQGSVITAGQVV
jgi:hypothetical protein